MTAEEARKLSEQAVEKYDVDNLVATIAARWLGEVEKRAALGYYACDIPYANMPGMPTVVSKQVYAKVEKELTALGYTIDIGINWKPK